MLFFKTVSIIALAVAALTSVDASPIMRRELTGVQAYVPLSKRSFTPAEFAASAALEKRSSAGWNDFNCKPSADHPYPLVLIHGLIGNGWDNWAYYGPRFAAKGYCTFSLTYGQLNGVPIFAGLDYMENSAQQLSDFVDSVLAATGASKVDFVGHSQGTLMPRYYLKYLGGAAKVHKYGGVGPIVYGTDLDGVVELAKKVGLYDPLTGLVDPACHSCVQLLIGSDIITKINAGGDAVPGVDFLYIASKTDELVTPYTNGFFKNTSPTVRNQVLQDYCITDLSEHLLVITDPIAFNALHAYLTPAAPQTINCLDAFM